MMVPQSSGSRPVTSRRRSIIRAASRCRFAGRTAATNSSTSPPVFFIAASRSALGRGLHRALVLAHLRQGLRRDDVGDAAERPLVAVRAGRLAPAGTGEAVLLAEESQEDLRLLLTEARQSLQS